VQLPETIAISEQRRRSFKADVSKIVVSRLSKHLKEGRILSKVGFSNLPS
jgi:hypothetical protein